MRVQHKRDLAVGLVVCVVGLSQLRPHTLTAAPAKSSDIAVIDIEELRKSYGEYRDDLASLQRFRQEREDKLATRQFLGSAEWDELDSLEARKNLKNEESRRLAELRNLSEARKKAIRELQSKPNPTDKDREELKRLNDYARASQVRLEELRDKLLVEIDKEEARLTQKVTRSLQDVYDKLATDRGYSLVLAKEHVQWSSASIEITREVLNRLNRK